MDLRNQQKNRILKEGDLIDMKVENHVSEK